MKLVHDGTVFVFSCSFEDRDKPKSAGFRWDPAKKRWWTDDPARAARLRGYADESAAPALSAVIENLAASRATDADVPLPAPDGLTYLPFQRAGIAYALGRPSTLIADEMGLGKTIQAIGVMNADASIGSVLVVCPASLKLNWKREIEKWTTRGLTVAVADGKHLPSGVNVVVANYDILYKHEAALAASPFDLLVVDEAHFVKNPKARRSRQVYALAKAARRRLFLTGTPIVNRPAELWPIVNCLDPARWPKFFSFARRYCNAFHNGFGWDFTGAAHLEELQERLRSSIMVRRLKADVLAELPAKRRQVIELAANGASAAVSRERAAFEAHEEAIEDLRVKAELAKADGPEAYAAAVRALQDRTRVAFEEISVVRHETALAKVPAVLEHLETATESGKVVCFAHHRDVVAAIAAAYPGRSVVINGETSIEDRQAAVDAFQTRPEIVLFIGSIGAAGVGITLTAASHVVFAELDWVPGNVTQAEDRCHRIGQRESVLIQHLVLEDSLDARLAKTLVAKQEVIDRALDDETMIAVVPGHEDAPATSTVKPSKLDALAAAMTPEEIALVHDRLLALAHACDGAVQKDGMGFNKFDSAIGKKLAYASTLSPRQAALGAVIVRKYHAQLGF